MEEFELSVCMTAHAETIVAGPTIRSAERAIGKLEDLNCRVQKIIAFDKPSEACRNYLMQDAFSDWEKIECDYGDQGKTRHELIVKSSGRYIALLDADDLYSENWLESAYLLLRDMEEIGEKAVVHPELNWMFDGVNSVYTMPSFDDLYFTKSYFMFANYYDALCVAPKKVWEEIIYSERDVKGGFAYEDWQWAVEVADKGWKHVIAKDTIIFKRRRDQSQNRESHFNRVMIRELEALKVGSLKEAR